MVGFLKLYYGVLTYKETWTNSLFVVLSIIVTIFAFDSDQGTLFKLSIVARGLLFYLAILFFLTLYFHGKKFEIDP